jgi:hypothetical protein
MKDWVYNRDDVERRGCYILMAGLKEDLNLGRERVRV